MASSPVIELQILASDSNSNISEILRKAYLISVKLDLKDIQDWINYELNGYPNVDLVPDYRKIRGKLKAFNPYRGWIPTDLGGIPEVEMRVETVLCCESISEIDSLSNHKKSLLSYIPNQMVNLLFSESSFEMAVHISPISLKRILEQVKTRVLKWSLELEKKGILGDGATFTLKEKEVAPMVNTFNFYGSVNNNGVLGSDNNDIQQNNVMNIVSGDFESLRQELIKIGLHNEDIMKLKDAIFEDKDKPLSSEKFGNKVSEWLGKMLAKAASGGWKITTGAAIATLTKLLCSYYGIS